MFGLLHRSVFIMLYCRRWLAIHDGGGFSIYVPGVPKSLRRNMFLRLSRRGRETPAPSAGGDELRSPVVNENLRGALSMPGGDDGGVPLAPMPGGLRTPAALLSYHQWYFVPAVCFARSPIGCGCEAMFNSSFHAMKLTKVSK